jgi:DNA-binding CsgD family transcriptional regulator
VLPPGAFGPEGALLVSVSFERAGPPPLPSVEALRTTHGLTRREAEIALLLAEGLTNSAIAERLFVSPHTARHHVENVMAKLEVQSRAAVATRLLSTQPIAGRPATTRPPRETAALADAIS